MESRVKIGKIVIFPGNSGTVIPIFPWKATTRGQLFQYFPGKL